MIPRGGCVALCISSMTTQCCILIEVDVLLHTHSMCSMSPLKLFVLSFAVMGSGQGTEFEQLDIFNIILYNSVRVCVICLKSNYSKQT